MAIGFVIGFSAGELEVATGIGGALVALGVACITIAHLSARQPYVSAPEPHTPPLAVTPPRFEPAPQDVRPSLTRDDAPPSNDLPA